MMELFKATKSGNTRNNRSGSGFGNTQMPYCWTRDISNNIAHTSETCRNKAENHIDTTTWRNKHEDSEKDYSKRE